MADSIIRDSLTCPITACIMRNPVQGNDGQTYERDAIIQWLSKNPISPITKQPMSISDLKVNASIRFLVDKFNEGKLGNISDSSNSSQVSISSTFNMPDISESSQSRLIYSNTPHLSNDSHSILSSVFKGTDQFCNNYLFKFQLNDESSSATQPLKGTDLMLVIDRSGSMQVSVEAKNENGESIENGFSQQDMVNHAAKTVAKSMKPTDRLGIIIFDNTWETIFNLLPMSEMNCCRALAQISEIRPRGQTDIWRATEAAIDLLYNREDKSRNSAVIVLTDGCPNISPSKGEIETLHNKRKKLNFYIPIYTFGFGYNLQEDLLYGMAKVGDGCVGHIPDGGMIATVFSNFLGNILCTVAYNFNLIINFKENMDYFDTSPIAGDFKFAWNEDKKSISVSVGTLQLGQSRNIIIKKGTPISFTYTYNIANSSYKYDNEVNTTSQNQKEVMIHSTRFFLVEKLREAIELKNCNSSAQHIYKEMIDYLNNLYNKDPLIKKILKNFTDQVKLALSENPDHISYLNGKKVPYFIKWGRWYLDQLSRALNQEQKPNFKDEACYFGGTVFNNIVDYASDQFDSLPAPKPSNISRNHFSSYNSSSQQPINMSNYNNQNNPCFTGTSQIMMIDGELKYIKDIIKGDIVSTLSDPYDINSKIVAANVRAVLKTNIYHQIDLVTFRDNLKITPWHPVLTDKGWQYPINLAPVTKENCDAVYSIILDNYHTCLINNIWCIGLGHGYQERVVKHDYFGTSQVIDDLKKLSGWQDGLVVIDSTCIIRDPLTNLVIGITENQRDKSVHGDYKLNVRQLQNISSLITEPLLQT